MNNSHRDRDAGPTALTTNPDQPPPRTSRRSLLILTALWLAIYIAGIFTPPLLDDVDTIHAEAAREMLLRHDWVTLYTNGFRYLEKAPLMYWSLAGSYEIFGIHDWSTRLPLMLGFLGMGIAS
jgi:4-amino-4-deoxy-L-arabinose transferase-like glycosyltransferase